MQSLIVRSVALSQVSLRRVHIIKTSGEFFIAGANMKTVAVVVRIFDVATISELYPFFLFAGKILPANSDK